jgi:hypothetical protein
MPESMRNPMSDDLATESLSHNTVSLWERRQQYEQWLASGRHLPKPLGHAYTGPCHTRTDEGPSTPILADKRAQAEAAAACGLINPLPPGAVVRTDEGDETANPSDDLRLNFAKALLPKIEGSDPETAERLTKAANAMLGPMVARADDAKKADEDVDSPINGETGGKQPKPPPKPGSSPLNRRADDEEEKPRKAPDDDDNEGDKLSEVRSLLKNLHTRLEKIEGTKKADDDDDSGSEDNPVNSATLGPEEGAPRDLVADDAKHRSDSLKRRTRVERIDEQIHDWPSMRTIASTHSPTPESCLK